MHKGVCNSHLNLVELTNMDNRSKIELKLAILVCCLLVAMVWFFYRSVKVQPVVFNDSTALSSTNQPSNLLSQPPVDATALPASASLTTPVTLSNATATATLNALSLPGDPTMGMPLLQVSEIPDPDRPDRIKRIRIVRANFKYPIWRVEEEVLKAQSGHPEIIHSRNIMIADHVMIRLIRETERDQLEALVKTQGLSIRKAMKMPGSYLVSIPDESTNALPHLLALLGKEKDLIKYVEPDYVVRSQQTIPNDPQFSLLWGLNNNSTPSADISAPQIWDLTTGSQKVIIGGIDTGIDYNHPDLASNIWHNTAETINGIDDDGNGYIDDVTGWNFSDGNNTPMDGQGHGTHTAGTMGAVGNNGIGVAGVNWHCQLIPLKFLDNAGNGVTSDAAEALHYVADLRRRGVNIKITNNSWGGGGYSATFRETLAENSSLGILFMAAAGNETNNNDITPFYPASYNDSNIISIAATGDQDQRAVFSNFGTNTVHIGAPGVIIYSTFPGARYGYMSGTSMATPHVSGVAALLWSLWPSARAEDIRDAILRGVDLIPSLAGKTITGGRLNARKAVDALFRILHSPRGNVFNSGSGYLIEFEVGPSILTDTNQVFIYWATDGTTNFNTAACENLSNTFFKALIPEQPEGTQISYWIQAAATNGVVVRLPTHAPDSTFNFSVVPVIGLSVTGTPSCVSNTIPDYGEHLYSSGVVIHAYAPSATSPESGRRWSCRGWSGTGSVPASGTSNALTFSLSDYSSLTWHWQVEFALTCTSSYAPLNTTAWWTEGTLATSLPAPSSVTISNTLHRFIGWTLDGVRHPDATSPADNPVTNIPMTTPHQVRALYLPESFNSDTNGMNDWWERLYFGNVSVDPNADPDGDGFDNRQEYTDQTNPTDPNSVPRPPVIIHIPLTLEQPRPAPYTITAIITDNCVVASAVMHWNRNGGADTAVSMTAGSNHLFTASIPAPGTNGDHFVYSIIASDLQASSTNGPFAVMPSYPEITSSPARYNCMLLPETVSNLTLTVTNSGVGAWYGRPSILWGGLSNDVEAGAGDWTHSGSNDLWNVFSGWSFSGSKAWYCGDPDTEYYANNMHAKLDSAPFAVAPGAQLTFWHWIDAEIDWQFRPGWMPGKCWDGGMVEISTNGGASFKQISPLGGYPYRISGYSASPWPEGTPCFAGEGSSWSQPTFDLSAYSGCIAIIRFHFGTDGYDVRTGWVIDDIVVSPVIPPQPWLTTANTNLVAPPNATTTMSMATLNSTGITSGNRDAILQIKGNTITNPVAFIPIHLEVRSPPTLTWCSTGQTSTNGTGQITLSNRLYDADGEPCLAAFEWRSAPNGIWSNTSLTTVQAEVGQAMLTGIADLPLSNLLTRSETGLITNNVRCIWDSKAIGQTILFSSNTWVRARTWDGIFWSNWVTSQPFMVDNEIPPTPSHFFSLVQQTNAWSKNPLMSLRWDLVQEARGSGVAHYEYGVTTNLLALAAGSTTTNRAGVPPPLSDGTNYWAWVRAVDQMGNLSVPALYGPCWIDVTPPSATYAVVSPRLSPFGNYVVGSNSVTGAWSGFSDGAGSGILGYYFAPTNAGGTTKGSWTTNLQGLITNLQSDRTNTLYVWAKDQTGWIGQAAYASFMALSSNSDWDQDGILNWQEEISGTDALQAGSVFQLGIAGNAPLPPGSFTLRWPGLSNRHYSIYYKDSLATGSNWINLPGATNITGTAGTMSVTDTSISQPSRFYRISVTAP